MSQTHIERLDFLARLSNRIRPLNLPVLVPYQTTRRLRLALALGALMAFCFFYGFFFSVLIPNLLPVLCFPLVLVSLLVIWVLPDVKNGPTRALAGLFYATFIGLIVWPNYLAIALPGLPWITVLRLTSFPMNFILLICVSTSAEFRTTLQKSLRALPAIPILLAAFVAIQFLSIFLSHDMSLSIQKFVIAQTTWTASFFVAAYVFTKPGLFKKWIVALWAMAIFVSLLAIWEYHLRKLPWAGHIPAIFQIDDDAVNAILAGNMRAYTNIYRAQSVFSTPLGLAEYLALTLPFVLHFTTGAFSKTTRLLATISIPILLVACFLTNAKLGMVGSLAGILLYVFTWAYQNWARHKHSLVAAATLFSYPAAIGAIIAALLFVRRFQVMILGTDGSHTASTNARIDQYHAGFQKFLHWPFGYGIGMGAATINPGFSGRITIDTYYLSVLLEYGIAGFVVYYGMFAIAIYEGGKRVFLVKTLNETRGFLLPLSISLIVFIIIKSVFSQQDNHPVVFMMLGAMMALISSYRKPAAGKGQR
jgi:hypothetical protein